jgi:hypothetical protein
MTDHNGLPVQGYTAQSDERVAAVNLNKQLEERCLRAVDAAEAAGCDPGMIDNALVNIMQGFMWLNRAIIQPERVPLPEDAEKPPEFDATPPAEGLPEVGPRLAPGDITYWWAWRDKKWVTFDELPPDAQNRVVESGVTVV